MQFTGSGTVRESKQKIKIVGYDFETKQYITDANERYLEKQLKYIRIKLLKREAQC